MRKARAIFGGRIYKQSIVALTALAVIFSSLGGGVLNLAPVARAASAVTTTTTGLINGNFPGAPIPASSPAIAILKVSVTASAADKTLTSLQVNFGGTGFATTDLASIATGDASGVALYNDAGGTAGSFDGTDAVVTLATSPNWTPSTTNIVLTPATPVALANGSATVFYVVIKTSGTIANDDRIAATLPINGVVTSDGSGPTAAFVANELRADTAAASIASASGFVGSSTVTVRFNKPVQKVGGGALLLADSPLVYVDGGGTAQTVTAIAHTAGQDIATLTMSGNLDAEDLDGSPATIAAGSSKIADMGGNVIGTSTVNFGSPLTITTATIPSATVGTKYTTASPLVALAASGGVTSYTFAANAAGDTATLSNLNLEIVNDGGTWKLTSVGGAGGTGAAAGNNAKAGSYQLNLRVTDSTPGTPLVSTKLFTVNVAPTGGGGVPGITNVSPPGGAQSSTNLAVTITGANTAFSGSSTVAFSLPVGAAGTNGITTGTVVANSATSITVPVTIAAGATTGSRDVTVTTGSQAVTMPNAFGVFSSGSSGLTLLFPGDAGTNVQLPPGFSFNPSANAAVASYRVTLKAVSDFSGTPLWDYVFPKPNDAQSSNGSHCGSGSCGLGYGAGTFRILTQPTPLSPNTTYYWQVRTYTEAVAAVADSATPLEATPVRGFTTVSSMTDVTPPQIMHRTVFRATENANLDVFARVMDNMATTTTTPALTTKIFYCAGQGCSATTNAAGTYVGSGYFKFRIPSATIGAAGTIVRYYLQASDGTNTQNFIGSGNTPFDIASVAAGASTIAGTVKDGSGVCATGVRQAAVFAEGTGFNATSSNDENCSYTLSGLSAGTYDIVAVKEGYSDRMMGGIPAGSAAIGFRLGQGAAGGFGGDTTKPRVKFTGPMDGMQGMPGNDSSMKVFVVFDKAMSQTAVTTAGNMTVNEVNLATGVLTDITARGAWTYYTTAPAGGSMLPPEANMAAWALTAPNTLGDNKTIAVVVLPNVTDTAGNSVQGNQSDGSYVITFTTSSSASFTNFVASTGTFEGGGKFGMGEFIPPRVSGTAPAPGSPSVPVNTPLVISFSDPMADDASGYVLKNFVTLATLSSAGVETDVSATAIDTVTLDSTKTNAKVTLKAGYNSGKFAVSTKYRLKVLGGAKSQTGLTLLRPGDEQLPSYTAEFTTGSSTAGDTAAPTVVGSYPDAGATGVSVGIGAVSVGFSKDMDASTLTTSTLTLAVGSSTVSGTVEYRPAERQALFVPQTALTPNTTYTLALTTSVRGINNVALAAVSRTFTTGSGDTVAPSVSFVNADDYKLAISFSEPMVAAKATDSLNFAASVLKAGNYAVKYGAAGASATGTAMTLPASATLSYDAPTNTVIITGYRDSSITSATLINQEIYVEVTGVKDLSGNAISTTSGANTGKSPIQNSATTKGALGPMSMGTDAFSGGGFMPTNFSSETFGFVPPVDVKPFNMMAGQTTIYGVRIPISKQIPAGGTIVLTFPTGFDVSGAKQDVQSPMRTDLNGPGTGTPTFKCAAASNGVGNRSCATTANADDTGAAQGGLSEDGVVVNTASRSVTVYLSAATNAAGNDFLNLDIAGIKNSTVPKDFNTSGYSVDVKTKNGTTVLESLTSMPFFIQTAGSSTLSGTITLTGNDQAGTIKVYLMSPMSGPMEADSVNFSDAVSLAADGATQATYSFASLTDGDYMLFTDQTVTLGTGGSAKEFVGRTMPERVIISGPTTYNFTLASATAGTSVTVSIDGPSGELLDIFAGSPTGFKAKQVTLDASAGAENFTMTLGNGTWYLGVGPQMPKGMMAGPPPTPTYVMPKPKELKVAGAACTVDGTVTCTASFVLATASKSIKGTVKDGASRVMANAEVYAYSPTGGYGTHAQSDATGAFEMKVADGSYIVGAFVPGMPSSREVPVTVTSHATSYLLIEGATSAITPAAAVTSFVLKVAKPDYTISGKVTDGTNAVQGASVYAYKSDGPGHANANTDTSGNYTLYVGSGTWKVGSFLPQYGQLAELTVVVSGASVAGQNFSPTATGTFRAVTGTVTQGGVPAQGAFVRINGNGTSNETATGSDGVYSFKVPEGNGYIVRAFISGVGESAPLAAFNVSTEDITGKDITVGTARVVTVTFSGTVTEAFVELSSSTGVGNRTRIANATSGTLSVPDGSYAVRVDVPGTRIGLTDVAGTTVDTVYSSTSGIVTVNAAEGLTVTLPTIRTVTGTVTDGTNPIAEAWVEIVHPTSSVHLGTKTAANGIFTLKVADSATAYSINVMKPGYTREPSSLAVSGGNPDAQTLVMSAATRSISGRVTIGSAGAASAFVRAEKQGGGFAGTQADAEGVYSISLSEGSWKVYAVAEGYAETALADNPVSTVSASATGKNIALATTVALNPPKSKPITPASGGTLEDTTAGVKLTVPANALGTSTSAGNINVKETNNVRSTETATPVGGKAVEIKATDSSGNAITNLSNEVTVEVSYTLAELAATKSATDTSINTFAEAEQVKMAYWDETTSSWVTQSSTVAYKNAAGTVITDLTTIDETAEFAATVATVTISAPTTHFSLYAPVSSTGTLPPSTPAGFTATSMSASQINLSWTAVSGATSYDVYRSATSGGTFARLGSEPTVASGSTTSYENTGLSASTTYYYKVTALNATGESGATAEASATTAVGTSGGGGGGGGGGSGYVTVTTPAATTATTPVTTTTVVATTTTTTPTTIAAPATPAVTVPTLADVLAIVVPPLPAAPTLADYQAVIAALSQKLTLLIQIRDAGGFSAQAAPQAQTVGQIQRSHDLGSRGDEVRMVQEVLKAEGSEVYPEGIVSGYFGSLTQAAVGRFQLKYGLVPNTEHPAYGFVGPATRAKLNSLR